MRFIIAWICALLVVSRSVCGSPVSIEEEEGDLLPDHFPSMDEEHAKAKTDNSTVAKKKTDDSHKSSLDTIEALYPEPYDPYNPKHKPPPVKDDLDDYDVSDVKGHEDDIGHHDDVDHVMSHLDNDHLLQLNSDSLPVFLLEPDNAYVIKNKPALLQCRAANALMVFFKCNGVKWSGSRQQEFVDPHSGVRIVEAECNITRNDVEEFFGTEKFRCDCFAWAGQGHIRSRSAYVEVAYLRKQFVTAPEATSVELYGQVALRCLGPAGAPVAHLSWLKNGSPLVPEASTTVIVSGEGHLLVSQATLQDMANYSCVAENVAGKRISDPALLTVYVNGGWSSWSQWTECRCPGLPPRGQRRTRSCTSPAPLNGGQQCVGVAIQKSSDCQSCHNADGFSYDAIKYDRNDLTTGVAGRWGAWSEWSRCARDCRQTRKRQCLGGGEEASCSGRPAQTIPCSGGLCIDGIQQPEEASSSSNTALYIGILLGFVVFTVVAGLVYRYFRKKDRDHSLYNMARSADFRPEFYPEAEKKSLSLQPDLTQHGLGPGGAAPGAPWGDVPPTSAPPQPPRRSSEHHYDVPHLTNSYALPMDHQASPSSESDNYDKKPYCESEHSTTSCFSSSECTFDVASESVTLGGPPAPPAVSALFAEVVGDACSNTGITRTLSVTGGRLSLERASLALSVPEGALARTRRDNFYISLVKEDRCRPKFPEGVTQLSPVVRTGPTGISLSKAAIVQIPHCASLKHGFWNLSVYALGPATHPKMDNSHTEWRKIVSLGQETINTPIFTQLDADKLFLVTDFLTTFVLAGESFNGKAVKNLKLAVYAPHMTGNSGSDYNIRVYVFEDTPCALFYCAEQEKRLGGVLIGDPKSLWFQDGGSSLCLSLEDIGVGWKAKPNSSYQEIPFAHVWGATSNSLHCSFTLEQTDSINDLEFKITVYQKMNPSHKQVFSMKSDDGFSSCSVPFNMNFGSNHFNDHVDSKTLPERSLTAIDEDLESSVRQKCLTVSDKGINTCVVDNATSFRLSKTVKKQLCNCLDPPNSRGNDWRLLAQKLNVDRYINFFATKSSPTEHILDLWECRHRNTSALADLANIFRSMGRNDAVRVIETCLGPSWL